MYLVHRGLTLSVFRYLIPQHLRLFRPLFWISISTPSFQLFRDVFLCLVSNLNFPVAFLLYSILVAFLYFSALSFIAHFTLGYYTLNYCVVYYVLAFYCNVFINQFGINFYLVRIFRSRLSSLVFFNFLFFCSPKECAESKACILPFSVLFGGILSGETCHLGLQRWCWIVLVCSPHPPRMIFDVVQHAIFMIKSDHFKLNWNDDTLLISSSI